MKGRHVTDLKHEILGLNINISQRTRLLYCNDSVLFHESNFTSVYIHILREIYSFWVAGLNVIISDIRSKASYIRHVNKFKIWVWHQIYNKIGLVSCSKVFSSIEIMWFNGITFTNWYGHYLQYSVKKSYRYINKNYWKAGM